MSDTEINMATLHRPQRFSDMLGQPFVQGAGQQLGKGVVSGQGYILAGPKGCGKTSTARIIAMSLNCENRDEATGDPCLECHSCVSIQAGNFGAVQEINCAANRGIGEMKTNLESMRLSITRGYRVYILDEAHMLTREAFSVLLKPMEEPPEHVIFILTTTDPGAIPETILSRSPIINIMLLQDDELTTILQSVVAQGKKDDPESWNSVTDDDIYSAVRSASGSARQAITNLSTRVLTGVSSAPANILIDTLVDAFVTHDEASALSVSLKILEDKTVDPRIVVTEVMTQLIGRIEHNQGMYSQEIVNLSGVLTELSASSPSVVSSARIASCVTHVQNQKQASSSAPKTQTQAPVASTTSKTSDERTGVKKKTIKLRKITPEDTVDDLLDYLLSEPLRAQWGDWFSVIDNDAESDFTLKDDVLTIAVDDKNVKVIQSKVDDVLAPVEVVSRIPF